MPEIVPPDNTAQLASSAYRLAIADIEFMLRDEIRPVRVALEYAKAELALRDWRIRSTIIVFGSARVPPPEVADAALAAARTPAERALAARARERSRWYDEARRFARIASERGGALGPDQGFRTNVIATGGGPGIMEAANRGAAEAGAPSIGFNISLPAEQAPNPWSTPELTFRFHYFAMRKFHFAMRAAALVVFPGGFGTMDELFELLTLQQTGKMAPVPVVLVGRAWWRRTIDFGSLLADGMIAAADLELFEHADDAEEAWSILERRGIGPGHVRG